MYCSGLPVVAAKAELSSFKKPGRSLIFSFATFVSILRFGIFSRFCKFSLLRGVYLLKVPRILWHKIFTKPAANTVLDQSYDCDQPRVQFM